MQKGLKANKILRGRGAWKIWEEMGYESACDADQMVGLLARRTM